MSLDELVVRERCGDFRVHTESGAVYYINLPENNGGWVIVSGGTTQLDNAECLLVAGAVKVGERMILEFFPPGGGILTTQVTAIEEA